MALLFALLFVLLLIACWLLTVLGLPGNWVAVVLAAVYAWLVPAESSVAFGWKTVLILLLLAALGEIVESGAGAIGASRAGGSKRGATLALVGSILGGIVGVLVGVPIPVVGSLVAAVLFAGLGAMAGAALGEMWLGRDFDTTWRIAKLAFWGRLAGTLGKIILGAMMIAVAIAAMLL